MWQRSIAALLLLFAGFGVGALTAAAMAERQQPLVYVVDFMRVDPADQAAYEALEREVWKAVHAERIERGLMKAWGFYAVRYPLGTDKPYDYVTVNVYQSFEDAERDPTAVFPAVHPDRSVEEVVAETRAVRELGRGEIWYRLDHVGGPELVGATAGGGPR